MALLMASFVQGQEVAIGQKVPDLKFQQVLNIKGGSLQLSALKGKLVIIDFWAPNCVGCFKSFPEMENLQRQYKNQLQFVLVNRESRDSTLRFFAARKKLKMPELPMICGDTLLRKLFPHAGVPFHVWIDQKGVLRYRTQGFNSTKEHISSFLKGKEIGLKNMARKNYLIPSIIDSGELRQLRYFSYLIHPADSISYDMPVIDTSSYVQYASSRNSVIGLYQEAFNDFFPFKWELAGQTVIELKDPYPYINPEDPNKISQWQDKYLYQYHVLLPKRRKAELAKIMIEDLNRNFDLDARIEKRMKKVLVLRGGPVTGLKAAGNKKKNNFYVNTKVTSIKNDSIRCLQGYKAGDFSAAMKNFIEFHHGLPFRSEVSFEGAIDICFPGSLLDGGKLEDFQTYLKSKGFLLEEELREIEVLVISDRDR